MRFFILCQSDYEVKCAVLYVKECMYGITENTIEIGVGEGKKKDDWRLLHQSKRE